MKLIAAVATRRTENVARQALGVHADEHGLVGLRVPHDEGHVRAVLELGVERVNRPRAPLGRQLRRGDAGDQSFGAHSVANQIGDRQELQTVSRREREQLRKTRHRSVDVHDLAHDSSGVEPREAAEIDDGLGVPGALQDPARHRAQRKDVARPSEIFGAGRRVNRDANRAGAVGRRDSGRHLAACLDRNTKCGAAACGVFLHHGRDLQGVQTLGRHRKADEAAPVGRHEIDDLRRDEFRGAREVALIFAVLVVQHDDDPAGAEIR